MRATRVPTTPATGADSHGLAIIITTYARQELLRVLLDSIVAQDTQPAAVYLIDNERSPETMALAAEYPLVRYFAQDNLGGAGGFARGVTEAFNAPDNHRWFWLMDDDVKLLRGAITSLTKYLADAESRLDHGERLRKVAGALVVRRRNFDDTPFYWQYQMLVRMAIPNPFAPSAKASTIARRINTSCFEGGVFMREVVALIGAPDPRFFIYGDDTTYGYLASKVTRIAMTTEQLLQRTRTLKHLKIGKVRKLNATSDMTRYYILRNRAMFANYTKLFRQYCPPLYALGTVATLAKEFIRLFITRDSFFSGLAQLLRGWRDSHAVLHDPNWRPSADLSGMPLRRRRAK